MVYFIYSKPVAFTRQMQKTKYDLIKNQIKKKVWNLLLGTVAVLKYKYCDRSLVLIWN